MDFVRAKKHLGQHFLKDQNIARKIVASLKLDTCRQVLEIGSGTGVLTQYLLGTPGIIFRAVEIDTESILYLRNKFPAMATDLIEGDFLQLPLNEIFLEPFAVVGNFPYNISSQIFFRILEFRGQIPEVVGMVQKEVAERISTAPGSKLYGILSVLLQAFYQVDYLFTVGEQVFVPPPRVKSAVIRLTRNEHTHLACDETLFFKVVKTAFNQRRKMLSNALKPLTSSVPEPFSGMRAEQLSVAQFEELTNCLQSQIIPQL